VGNDKVRNELVKCYEMQHATDRLGRTWLLRHDIIWDLVDAYAVPDVSRCTQCVHRWVPILHRRVCLYVDCPPPPAGLPEPA
jgi:hypothetical protein